MRFALLIALVLWWPIDAKAASAEALNQNGIQLFVEGNYQGALDEFERALRKLKDPSSLRLDVRLNIANSHRMLGHLNEARSRYDQLMVDDPDQMGRYRAERLTIPSDTSVSGDADIAALTAEIIGRFGGIRLPVSVHMLAEAQNNAAHLQSLGVDNQYVAVAQGSTVDGEHIVLLNGAFWEGADDRALTGVLAHELMHREWQDAGLDALFDWTRNALAYASLEHVIDYCVVGKGLHEELYVSKTFMLEKAHPKHLSGDIAPNAHHLADVLARASQFAMPGSDAAITASPIPAAIAADVERRLAAFAWHGAAEHLTAAVANPSRPEGDRDRDANRQPAEVLSFYGIEPGMQVAELMAGRGYYTEILSHALGSEGTLYVQNNRYVLERFAEEEISKRLAKPSLDNAVRHDREIDALDLPAEQFDAILMVLFYHDTYWMEADRDAMNAQIFAALKPGGLYGVVDHHAIAGSGDSVTKTLHRGDAEAIKAEVLRAGFIWDGESPVLEHPVDDRTTSVFAESIRGQTDRFVYRFRKPAQSATVTESE